MLSSTLSKLVFAHLLAAALLGVCLFFHSQQGTEGRPPANLTIVQPLPQWPNVDRPHVMALATMPLRGEIEEKVQTTGTKSRVDEEDKHRGSAVLKMEGPIASVAWSSDGKLMAVLKRRIEKINRDGKSVAVRHHTVRIHDAKSGNEIISLGELANDGLQDFCFSSGRQNTCREQTHHD